MAKICAPAFMPYYLHAQGQHDGDVRTLCVCGPEANYYATGSYDGNVRVWKASCHKGINECIYKHKFHTGKVSCIAWADQVSTDSSQQSSDMVPFLGTILSGSYDKTIVALDIQTKQYQAFEAHENNVSCITSYNGVVISGSWDHTTRIQRLNGSTKIMEGHTESVLSVCVLEAPNSQVYVLTGSGDKLVICWDFHTGKQVRQYTHHKDSVRCIITCFDKKTLWSCGNDALIFQFDIEGNIQETLSGHESFVYALGVLSEKEIVSVSEDRSMRIWCDGALKQVVYHPNTLWSVAILHDQSIVTGCADGYTRLWTRDAARAAPCTIQDAFTDAVGSFEVSLDSFPFLMIDQALVTDIPEGTLAWSFGSNGERELKSWSINFRTWIPVGKSRKSEKTRKPVYNGQSYDFLFDIDFNGKMLKLPFNKTENTLRVARTFVEKHRHLGMDTSHESEILKWLIKNASLSIENELPHNSSFAQSQTEPTSLFPGDCKTYTSTNFSAIESCLMKIGVPIDPIIKNYLHHTKSQSFADSFILESILELIRFLPPGSKYPALDLARGYMWHNDRANWTMFFDEIVEIFKSKDETMDVVVCFRIMANYVVQAKETKLPGTLERFVPIIFDNNFVNTLYTKTLLQTSNQKIRDGFSALLWNISLRLREADEASLDNRIMRDAIDTLFSYIGLFLLSEISLDRKLLVLRTLSIILQLQPQQLLADNHVNHPRLRKALQTLCHDINTDIRRLAKSLLE